MLKLFSAGVLPRISLGQLMTPP